MRDSFAVAPHEGLANDVATVRVHLGPEADGSIRADRVTPAELEHIESGLASHDTEAVDRIANLIFLPWRGDRRSVAMATPRP